MGTTPLDDQPDVAKLDLNDQGHFDRYCEYPSSQDVEMGNSPTPPKIEPLGPPMILCPDALRVFERGTTHSSQWFYLRSYPQSLPPFALPEGLVVPFNNALKITDREMSGALHLRTLERSHDLLCSACGSQDDLGHQEVGFPRICWV